MKPRLLLHRNLSCVLLTLTASVASAQILISDSFTSVATTNSLWSKNLDEIPVNFETPSLVQNTGAGTLTFNFRPTIFSIVDLPADHQGSISFMFEPAGGELLSVGLRGSSTRDSGSYGSFYGLTLEFHQYLGQLRLVDYSNSGNATVIGSHSFDFASEETYDFTWQLTGSDLSVTQAGGDTYDFGGVTVGAGSKIFINNSQDGAGFVLYDVSVSAVSAIPEPSTYAAFAGLLAGVVAFQARRRRQSPLRSA